MNEEEKKENEKEETPTWAKNLQESLDSLPDRLSQLLNPQQNEPEETDPNAPMEIPIPEPPQQENPEPEPMTEPEPPKKSKVKSFLDFLL